MLLLALQTSGQYSLSDASIENEQSGEGLPLKRIGMGQYAKIYKTTFQGETIAVKILYLASAKRSLERLRERMVSEIALMEKLPVHLNIISYRPNLKIVDGYALEFVSGVDLETYLESHPNIPLYQRSEYGLQTLNGLRALHQVNILHRDLKPANLMFSDTGQIKICDFGFGIQTETSVVSKKNAALGTPLFMAPELIEEGISSKASDIYAFGILFWEILTNEVADLGYSDIKAFFKAVVARDERPCLTGHDFKKADVALKLFLFCLWQKDPNVRPTATDAYDQLEKVIQDYLGPAKSTEKPSELDVVSPQPISSMALNRYNSFYTKHQLLLGLVENKNFTLVAKFLEGITDETILLSKVLSKKSSSVSPFLIAIRIGEVKIAHQFIKHPVASSDLFDVRDDFFPYGALYHTLCTGNKFILLLMLNSPHLLLEQFEGLFSWENKDKCVRWINHILYPPINKTISLPAENGIVESIHCVLNHRFFKVQHLQKIVAASNDSLDHDSVLFNSSTYKLYIAIKNAALKEMDAFAKELWLQPDATILNWAHQILEYNNEKKLVIPDESIYRTSLMNAIKSAELYIKTHDILYSSAPRTVADTSPNPIL